MHTCTESIKYYPGDNFVGDVSLNSISHLSWIEHGYGYILRLWRWGSRALHQRPRSTFLLHAIISISPKLQIERERWTNYHSIIWQFADLDIDQERGWCRGVSELPCLSSSCSGRSQSEVNLRRVREAYCRRRLKRLWRSGTPRAWWLLR